MDGKGRRGGSRHAGYTHKAAVPSPWYRILRVAHDGIERLRLVALSRTPGRAVGVALPDKRVAIRSRRRAGEERRVDGLAVQGGLAARIGEVHRQILDVAERVDVVAALPRPLETEMILPRALVIYTCTTSTVNVSETSDAAGEHPASLLWNKGFCAERQGWGEGRPRLAG